VIWPGSSLTTGRSTKIAPWPPTSSGHRERQMRRRLALGTVHLDRARPSVHAHIVLETPTLRPLLTLIVFFVDQTRLDRSLAQLGCLLRNLPGAHPARRHRLAFLLQRRVGIRLALEVLEGLFVAGLLVQAVLFSGVLLDMLFSRRRFGFLDTLASKAGKI
jgi:hypothetical protein